VPTRVDPASLPADWWTAIDCAAYLGITPATWRSYVGRDQAPKPDRTFGHSNAWRPATVQNWDAQRPRLAG